MSIFSSFIVYQLECSTEDKDGCNNTMRGSSNHYECYCKTDYCNGSETTTKVPGFAALTASALLLAVRNNVRRSEGF